MPGMMRNDRREDKAIRREYETHGVEAFYRERGEQYRNPHEPQVRRSVQIAVREWNLDLSHILDLAAGSGEATLELRGIGAKKIEAIDPFTHEAYRRRTGLSASRESFKQIAEGALAGRHYSLIVCSFALHLLENSRLPKVSYQLSLIGETMLIVTPHKRPQIEREWGWELSHEMVVQRVRSRLYKSRNCPPA